MEQLSYLEIDGKQLEIVDESARSTADSAINTANTAKSTADSANNIAGSAKSTAETAIDAAETATAIAKGRNQAHVFNTTDAMKSWLSDANNKGIYNKGDNIYIVDVGVPDWWVSEVLQDADIETGYYYKIAQLETQKVDLTEINAEISQINSSLTASDNLKFHFATDGEGNYGFLGADGSLIPFINEPKTGTITVVFSNSGGLSTQYVEIPSDKKLVGLVTFETNAWKYSSTNLSSYRPYCDFENNRIVFETYGVGSMRNEMKVTYLYYDN